MCVSKTSDNIQLKIKMPNPNQEPPASSWAPIEDLKDMDVLCTFKMKTESQNLEYRWIKTSYHIKIKIKMPSSSHEPPAPIRFSNQDFKNIYALCTFNIKIESINLEHGCIKNQWPYPNQDQDLKPQSGTSSPYQSLKLGLRGYEHSLRLQNQMESQDSESG